MRHLVKVSENKGFKARVPVWNGKCEHSRGKLKKGGERVIKNGKKNISLRLTLKTSRHGRLPMLPDQHDDRVCLFGLALGGRPGAMLGLLDVGLPYCAVLADS